MQFLVLIGPNHLGLNHLLILKPDTEARGMGWLAWPGLDQGLSLKLGAWMLLNQKYPPLSSSVELHTSP